MSTTTVYLRSNYSCTILVCKKIRFILISYMLCSLTLTALAESKVNLKEGLFALCPPLTSRPENISIQSQVLFGGQKVGYTAQGSVSVNHPEMDIASDRLQFTPRTGRFHALNNVFLQQGRYRIWSDEASYEDTHAVVEPSYITVCPGSRETVAWHAAASKLRYNREEERVTAWDATLWFQQVPFFYTPYLHFSLKRTSGLLLPTFGTYTPANSNNEQAAFYHQGAYFNLAPNYDATLYATWLDNRGTLLSGEGRYLTASSKGVIRASVLQDDPILNSTNNQSRDFSHFFIRHQTNFTKALTFNTRFARYTPRNFHENAPNVFEDRPSGSFERFAYLTFTQPAFRTRLSVRDNLSLSDPQLDSFQRLPQIDHTQYIDREGRSTFTFRGQYAQFVNPDTVQIERDEGQRFVLNPYWRWHYTKSSYRIETEAGGRYNHYQLLRENSDGDTAFSFANAYIHTGVDFYIENTPSWLRGDFQTTLIPTAHYIYVPFVRQDHLPSFDASNRTITVLQQLYDPLVFNGEDRMGDANRFVLALNQEAIHLPSQSYIRASIGRNFDITTPTVTRSNNQPFEDIFTEIVYRQNIWNIDTAAQWSDDLQTVNFFSANILVEKRNSAARLNFLREGNVESNNLFRFLAFGSSVALDANWRFSHLVNYSIDGSRLNDLLLGFSYDDCCWQLNFFVDSRLGSLEETSLDERPSEFRIELVFKGLISVGHKEAGQILFDRSQGFSQ